MTRILPGVIAMAIIVVASNILVQFLLLDGLLTWGAFSYPFAFLVTDITNRVYGAASARRVLSSSDPAEVFASPWARSSASVISATCRDSPAIAPPTPSSRLVKRLSRRDRTKQ